jgi:WD40 repeat protein
MQTSPPRIAAPSFKLRKSTTVVFSRSGRYLAQICARVFIWDTIARKIVSQFKVISNEHYVAFSPDEQTLAVKNTNGELVFCDVLSGRVISETGKYTMNRQGSRPAFTADGRHLIDCNWTGVMRLVEVATAKDAAVRDFGSDYMFADVGITSTNRCVVALGAKDGTRGGGKLFLFDDPFDINEPVLIPPLAPHQATEGGWRRWIDGIALHPSGDKLALYFTWRTAEEPNSIELISLTSGQSQTILLDSRSHAVEGLAWSESGVVCASVHENLYKQGMAHAVWQKLKASGTHEHLHFYSDTTGDLLARWPWPDAWQVAFSPNGTGFAVGSRDIPGAYFADFSLSSPS